MNKLFFFILIDLLLLTYLSSYAQLSYGIDKLIFYHVKSEKRNIVIDNGCIGPCMFVEGYIKNISSDTIQISTMNSCFILSFTYKGINYIEDLVTLNFNGLDDSIIFVPDSIYSFALESKTAFRNAFYKPNVERIDYRPYLKQIIPSIRIIYIQPEVQSNRIFNLKLFTSQRISLESIKYSFDN